MCKKRMLNVKFSHMKQKISSFFNLTIPSYGLTMYICMYAFVVQMQYQPVFRSSSDSFVYISGPNDNAYIRELSSDDDILLTSRRYRRGQVLPRAHVELRQFLLQTTRSQWMYTNRCWVRKRNAWMLNRWTLLIP